jgi:hypothetical protein
MWPCPTGAPSSHTAASDVICPIDSRSRLRSSVPAHRQTTIAAASRPFGIALALRLVVCVALRGKPHGTLFRRSGLQPIEKRYISL